MLRLIRKVKKRKNRFSVNSQNLLNTICCESTVIILLFIHPAGRKQLTTVSPPKDSTIDVKRKTTTRLPNPMVEKVQYPSLQVLGQKVWLCNRRYTCEDHCGRNRTKTRACFCDDVCLQMGDCCIDYEHRCIYHEKIPSWEEARIYKIQSNGTHMIEIPPLLDGMFDIHILSKYQCNQYACLYDIIHLIVITF